MSKFINTRTGRFIRQNTRTFNKRRNEIIEVPSFIINPVTGKIIDIRKRTFRSLVKNNELYITKDGILTAPIIDFSALSLNQPLDNDNLSKLRNFIRSVNINYPIKLNITSILFNANNPIEQNLVFYSEDHLVSYFTSVNRIGYEDNIVNEQNVWSFAKVKVSKFIAARGGCNKNKAKTILNKKIGAQKLVLDNKFTGNNDCGIQSIRYFIDIPYTNINVRNMFNLKYNEKIPCDTLYEIYDKFNFTNKKLLIIDNTYNKFINLSKYNYIYYHNNHFNAVIENTFYNAAFKKNTRKGFLAFDFETRKTNENIMLGDKKLKKIKDTICSVVYKEFNSNEIQTKVFTTDKNSTSARKFVEFLIEKSLHGKYFHVNAFNGSRFDFYLIYSQLTNEEIKHSNIQLRGYSIINFKLYNHSFTDLSNFIISSLSKACKSYKIDKAKMIETKYGSSSELCFYKPELSFDNFMKLQFKEPEFWDEYVKYCVKDSEALFELWMKFRQETNELVSKTKSNNRIKIECSNTIGSYSKKLALSLMPEKWYKMYETFCDCPEKDDFIRKCVRGGISFSRKDGVVNDEVTCVDITSQYPDALMKMVVPLGKSNWVNEYNAEMHGYYLLEYITFKDKSFKPVAVKNENDILDWNIESAKNFYIGSQMLRYLINNGDVVDFKVKTALVSKYYTFGNKLFSPYINTFFSEKKRQDTLKETEEYNPSKREVCKLFLNSLSGKLVENPKRYQNLIFTENGNQKLNGNNIAYKPNNQTNPLLGLGICMYDYSKINLFNSINKVGGDNILNCETDSLFFPSKFLHKIENEDFFGDELGQINVEGKSKECIFLGKKSYWFDCNKSALKGIPKQTIDESGKKFQLYNRHHFVKLANNEPQTFNFNTIKKNLFGNEIYLATGEVSRTIQFN